jgi:hypothetical protein
MQRSFGYLSVIFCAAIFLLGDGASTAASAQSISYLGVPLDIGSGLQSSLLRAQLSTGAHGGVTVRIESADTTLAFISEAAQTPGTPFVDVFVPNGSVNANFYVQTIEDTTGTVTITATAPGFTSKVDSINVVTPGIRLFSVAASVDVFAADDPFQIQTGIPNVSGSNLMVFQAARAGGPGLTATVSNSNAAVGELVTTGLSDQVVSVIILPGQNISGGSVALGGVAFNGTAAGTTEITASIPGFVSTSADTQSVNVTASTITYTATPFLVGSGLQTGQKRVTLSGSEHGGVTVHIEPGDTNLALVAPTSTSPGETSLDVFIANGVTQGNFYIHGIEDTTAATAITASAPGFIDGVDTAFVVTPSFRIASLASSIDVFDPEDVFVVQTGLPKTDNSTISTEQKARPGGPGLEVTLNSSDSLVGVFVTASDTSHTVTVPIAAGQSTTPGSVGTGGVAFDGIAVGTTEVTAAIPGFVPSLAGSLDVTVTTPGISMLNLPTSGVGAGLMSGAARARLAATAHGGITVSIVSSEPGILLVSTHTDSVGVDSIGVAVPDGQSDAVFYIHGVEDTTGSVNIIASAPLFNNGEAFVDIVQPGLAIVSLGNTIDTIDPPDNFVIQAGVPISGGLSLFGQNVRTGSPGVTVSAAVNDSLLAQVLTLADTSHVVSRVIPAGQKNTPSTVGSGGVALDGLALGSVTVSATAPGFAPIAVAEKAVTITAPTISIVNLSVVGAGLQGDVTTATLSTGGHGGVMVHVESSDSTVALVSAGVDSAGAGAADIFVVGGSTQAQFYVHGVDDTTGSATITVSAPQFVSQADGVTIVQPAVDILSLASSIDVGDPQDEFVVRVGVPFGGNGSVQIPQRRRGGAAPLIAAVTSADTSVARVVTTAMSGDSVTVEIVAAESQSPVDVSGGGVALQPVGEGQTIVFAAIPGFIQTGAAQQTVDVTNSTIIYLGLPSALGAGLETNVVTAQLGSSNHGGVTVHIEVGDTLMALVSANALVLGNSAIDVVVPNGQTDAAFYLQALEGASGHVTVTASASTFTTEVDSVDIVPAAVQIVMLPDSMLTTDPDAEFVVQIGATLPDSSGIVESQLIRPGGTPALVSVTSTDTLVGALVTSTTSGDTATATIGVGVGQTPATVLLGGMAFRAVGSGATLVEASVPGFLTTKAGSTTVYVTGGAVGVPKNTPTAGLLLAQNVPNPFNPTTMISFTIPHPAHVELSVFDLRGSHVITLMQRPMAAGRSSVEWSGRDAKGNAVSSGIYFYRLRAGSRTLTKKMVLLK